ncbi:hypothetical protein HWV62_20704 [Athelia sp. TMB]|nr:hypothetical protein HWV62_20704 [Athelia sp. TMB]
MIGTSFSTLSKFWVIAAFSAATAQALTYHCADFSSLPVVEAAGVTYKTSGTTEKFETILANNGVNMARIRVWTAGDYDLNVALATAKRAHAAGMSIYVDLHYSDTWADPGDQAIPSSWPTTLAGLNAEIYTYTLDLVQSFTAQGTPITILALGNEINNGILFPVGETTVNGYDGLSQLLHSAASGARAGSSTLKTMIHLADGWEESAISTFYENIFRAGEFAGTDIDIMGFSFYPFFGTGATIGALQDSLESIFSVYGKDVMVVETNWPYNCSGVALSDTTVPISAAGQSTWVGDIETALGAISGALGICYWEPGWVGNANLGSPCSDNLLVDSYGITRTSIAMFSEDM